MRFKRGICWIRRDCRLEDHAALAEATRLCQEVALCFIFDPSILSTLTPPNRRVGFLMSCLADLRSKVQKHGSQLTLLYGEPPSELLKFSQALGAEAVFYNRDYEPSAKLRDLEVSRLLESHGIQSLTYKDSVIFESHETKTQSQGTFRVFTPYKNRWLENLAPSFYAPHPTHHQRLLKIKIDTHSNPKVRGLNPSDLGFQPSPPLIPPGTDGALKMLKAFMNGPIRNYKRDRDFPAIQGTSGLSAHLRFGTISIRQLVREAMPASAVGASTWLSELIWRDFYQMILNEFPYVENSSFKIETQKLRWPGKEDHFHAWREGRTGFPMVDAAMRQLNQTGWMHNRLRMVVGSFLTKDLLIDWRWGARYFAEQLLDHDLAANNGGWQWCASTGCDAQPYFRVFNPVNQSEKFDPQGEFIRTYCPELKGFSAKDIHWPHGCTPMEQALAGCRIGVDYPSPLVEHSVQRERAITLFRQPGRS